MLDEPRNTQQAEDSCAKHGVQVNALSPPPAMAPPSTMYNEWKEWPETKREQYAQEEGQ